MQLLHFISKPTLYELADNRLIIGVIVKSVINLAEGWKDIQQVVELLHSFKEIWLWLTLALDSPER